MRDRVRHFIPIAIATVMVMAIAPATMLAQEDESAAIEPAAGINADTVDGRHAVGSGASKAWRARKLVATNKRGLLPSNIVKPYWGAIKNKPAAFADGRIHWNEVVGKPAGFADGVDAGDKTSSAITFVSVPLAPDEFIWLDVITPPSLDAGVSIIPVEPGVSFVVREEDWYRMSDGRLRHGHQVQNAGLVTSVVKARAVYWNVDYVSPAAAEKAVTIEFHRKNKNRTK